MISLVSLHVRVYCSVERKEDILLFILVFYILAHPYGWNSKRAGDYLNPGDQGNKALF